jgi:hypothetical protein
MSRRVRRICWSVAAFFALGYFPTALIHSPVASMSAAACLIIPFGSTARSLWRGALRGVGLGFLAGAGIWSALSRGGGYPYLSRIALSYVPLTMCMCGAVAVLCAYLAENRRRHVDDEWER